MEAAKPNLLDTCRKALRLKHYAWKTEQAYLRTIIKFIHYCQFASLEELKRAPAEAIEKYLTAMVEQRNVSASTQNVALSALLFLYAVLKVPVGNIDAMRAKRGKTLTELPNEGDVERLLAALPMPERLACQLQYGCCLRVSESVRLRVKDCDFLHGEILIHEPKHGCDRVVMLPKSLVPVLHAQIAASRKVFDLDRRAGLAGVHMPDSLDRKYPNASKLFRWHWLLPSPNTAIDPRGGERRRHHISIESVSATVRRVSRELGIEGFHCHKLRHSGAHDLLMRGYQIGAIQELLGHKSILTTMGYAHSTPRGGVREIVSPLDV